VIEKRSPTLDERKWLETLDAALADFRELRAE